MPTTTRALPLLLLLSAAGPAAAQEAMYTQAATMASPNTFILRQMVHFYRFGENPNTNDQRTDKILADTSLQIGLARGLSLTVDTEVEAARTKQANGLHDSDSGIGEVDLTLKYRFYQDDSGGIDTTRLALFGGVKMDTSRRDDFNANPHLGIVLTKVMGRHGINLDTHYTLTTGGDRASNYFGGEGPADSWAYNAAYLYRLYPDAYAADSTGAWYLTLELNGQLETNGDHDLRFSPGIMFEGRTWGLEIMAQIPIYQQLDHRPDMDFGVGFGLRFLF
jgi:hypothetical protein